MSDKLQFVAVRDAVDFRQQTERTGNRRRKSSKLIMTDDG
jgi:hypothetical protein